MEEKKMNYYIGIDLSLTGTGFVCLNEEEEICIQELIKTSSKDEMEFRINKIISQITDLINSLKVDSHFFSIWIEGLSFGSRGQSMLELAGLHYSLRLLFFQKSYIYHIIPPTVLKKYVTGKGNSKKELMLLKVYKKWGVEFSDNNICDGFCLSRLGLEADKDD